jgi:hypothetical protein
MSVWSDLGVEACVVDALIAAPDAGHHFGRPFMTAYQLAIEVDRVRPDIALTLDVNVGGAGIGHRTSLAQYLAGQLSRHIRANPAYVVEGAFLSTSSELELRYSNDGAPDVLSSLTGSGWSLSMYRLRRPHA